MKESMDQKSIDDLVIYRINRAKETIEESVSVAESGFYNTAVNRLYYACYYAVIALLVKNKITAQTHAGVRQMLGLHFVYTKRLDTEYSRFYTQLFSNRISGDYDDFVSFDKEMVDELMPKAKAFINAIEKLL